jgi:hypothetical protein
LSATKTLLVELSKTRAHALQAHDEATADEATERLMSALAELLELGEAAETVALASDELGADFHAVDSLHELAQAVVEEDSAGHSEELGQLVHRLVLIPVSIARRSSAAAVAPRVSPEALSELERLALLSIGATGMAELKLNSFLYATSQLTQASYDQLYNLLPALQAQDLAAEQREALCLEARPVSVSTGHGTIRYLVGVLTSPVEIDAGFVMDEPAHVDEEQAMVLSEQGAAVISKALGDGWSCLHTMELAPFFEGVTMGEHFAREASFTMDVLMGLEAARVAPRATMAHVSLPEGQDVDRVEVQLLGMDSVPVASAFWEVLEPADPDAEVAQLMNALERVGVRTKPDASIIQGYGTA